jgi:SET domain
MIRIRVILAAMKRNELLMMRLTRFLVAVGTVVCAAVSVVVVEAAPVKEDPDCRLWLAPSYLTTEKTTVLGMFAGAQGFSLDEIIPSQEIAIPVYDYIDTPVANRDKAHRAVVEYLEQNTWLADFAGSKFETNSSTSAYIPGIGAIPRYHSGISNIEWIQASLLLRSPDELATEIRGQPHISRGAITHYYNATIRASRNIRPGMEIFANYGEGYDDNDAGTFHEKILREDYDIADKLLDKILHFMNHFKGQMSETLQDQVLDFMLEKVLHGAAGKHAKVIRSLIPAHPAKLQRVKDAGGTFAYRNFEIIRDLPWLYEHGQCIDNMVAGRSTIDDAGRGAFARRALAAGSTISPVPFHPIRKEEVLDVYTTVKKVNRTDGKDEYVLDETAEPTGGQLLINYCFGHAESTLFLLPTAPMVNLVNHAPKKSDVNAILRWSKHQHVANDNDLHDVAIRKWGKHNTRPIVMELVATRDIKEGEEILIDYGDDWAEAWATYKADWIKQTQGAKWPLKALDVRHMYQTHPYPAKIAKDQQPYPPGVITACYLETVDDLPDGQPKENAAGQKLVQWLAPATYSDYAGVNMAICDVVDRQDYTSTTTNGTVVVSYNYTVLARTKDSDKLLEVRKVPHAAITLVDRPYTSDIHMTGVFRRWISVEDQRFPQAWRNVRE